MNKLKSAALLAVVAALAACNSTPTSPTAASSPAAQPSQAKQAAPTPAPASQPMSSPQAAEMWANLEAQVGKYPNQATFLRQGIFAQRLRGVAGADANVVLRNLEVASPLRKQGNVYYISGNRKGLGGSQEAAVALDANNNTMRIWLLQGKKARVMEDPGASFAWPADIQTQINNSVVR